MTFQQEPTGYEKTILSELQGAWNCLLEAVIKSEEFEQKDKVIFHIYEATSWENVRDLDGMNNALLVIRNIILLSTADEEVKFWLNEVDDIFREVRLEIANGKWL